MYLYRAYGLVLQSPIALPELLTGEGSPDVLIYFGEVRRRLANRNNVSSEMSVCGTDIYLNWSDVGSFLIRDGREIVVEPIARLDQCVLRLFILGSAFAMLLCQRELTVLHASAVAVGKEAVAFAGVKGAGKSTIAAALNAEGHELVADDIVAINTEKGGEHLVVLPGFPHLKLWPDSLTLLGYSPQKFPRLRPELEKRSYRLRGGFLESCVPLRAIFLIGFGPVLEIESLQAGQAVAELMPHWYGARFGMRRLRALGLEKLFRQCVGIANSANVYRLTRPQSRLTLSEITDAITEKLTQDARAASNV